MALLWLVAFACAQQPAFAQVAPAQWDTLTGYVQSLPNNNPSRAARARLLDYIAKLRAIPVPVRVDTVRVTSVDTVRITEIRVEVRVDTITLPCLCGTIPADTVVVPPPPPPDTLAVWNRVVRDTAIVGDLIVTEGERWLIGPGVRLSGNLRCDAGAVAMRPGSSLTFVGATRDQYIGGGMRYSDAFANDWGVWIGGSCALDIQGTPVQGWARDWPSSWRSTDEVWITPTAPGDYTPRRYNPVSDTTPPVDERLPGAELVNVTRDVEIIGPGHIHVSSTVPATIRYATLRGMGVLRAGQGAAGVASGRYAIHLHFQGDGARGSVIEGVALVDSEGRGFVPHASHGVTMRDNVAVNGLVEGFWWDPGEEHATNDISVDRLLVCGVFVPRTLTGVASRFDAINLAHGLRNRIDNSVACGSRDGNLSNGFNWATGPSPLLVWDFGTGNVAHNNQGVGSRIWNNSREDHRITVTAYNNGAAGIQNGAYNNTNRYDASLLIGNGVLHNSSSNLHTIDGGPGRYTDLTVEAPGTALTIGQRNLPARSYQEFVDCRLTGTPKVFVQSGVNPWLARFIRCDVTPTDIVWEDLQAPGIEGSHVLLEHTDGRKWEVSVTGGRVVTRAID